MRKARSLVPGRGGALSDRGSRGSEVAFAGARRPSQARRAAAAVRRPSLSSPAAVAAAVTFSRETISSVVTGLLTLSAAKQSHYCGPTVAFPRQLWLSQLRHRRQGVEGRGRSG